MRLFHKIILHLILFIYVIPHASAINQSHLIETIEKEERQLHASIGLAIIDTASEKTINYKGNQRFPLNSTHKALICAALLKKADNNQINLNERIHFDKTTLIDYSPITENFIHPKSMNWLDLCSAAVSHSDNTAANLIHKKIGGPSAMKHFFMQLQDHSTRLDRYEPNLNSAIPNDPRDTTTPMAISKTLQKLTLENVLSPTSRKQLIQWMIDDKVADTLLRAVLPNDWTIADKTGAGGFGSRGIIAVVWPKDRKPIIIAIYIKDTKATMAQKNKSIANIGKAIFISTQ